jgi:hypothetical protein
MNELRSIAFWIGCIGIRTLFAYLAYIASNKYLQIMGALALVPAIGFIVIHIGGLRKRGIEVAPGGGEIWWSTLRPVHGFLYLAFAVLALCKRRGCAWVALAADVFIGVLAKLFHYRQHV